MQPRRSALSPALSRWIEAAGPRERRTVLIRVRYSSDADVIRAGLMQAGVEAGDAPSRDASSGRGGTLTCVVTPENLRRLTDLSWVRAVEEPRRFHFDRDRP